VNGGFWFLVCVFITVGPSTKLCAWGGGDWGTCACVLLLQDLLQSCVRGGRRRVEDMCYERRRAEACVDESAHHALRVLREFWCGLKKVKLWGVVGHLMNFRRCC
jgi:hypothetical protein